MSPRQVVFTIPRMLRIFFKYNRRLLGSLCRCALRSLTLYFEVLAGGEVMPGVIAAIQTFGARINLHPHLHFLVTEGGVGKDGLFHKVPRIDDSRLASLFKGWAEMIRKVYEVDPMICPPCGATMKGIAFLTDYAVVDRIIDHLKLTFVADKPPPPQIAYQEVLMAAETAGEYIS